MTTLISLASRDFIVVGCDSLATFSMPLLKPKSFETTFFDHNGELRKDSTGKPILQKIDQIWQAAELVPVNQLPSVTKVFDLMPKKAAVLFAGAARINDITVKNIVEAFKESDNFKKDSKYTIRSTANLLKDYLLETYISQIPRDEERPSMEVILSGYSYASRQPEIYKITFDYNWNTNKFNSEIQEEVKTGDYSVVFGGQYDVIQRVVFGIDLPSFSALKQKSLEILRNYRSELQEQISKSGTQFNIPDINDSDPKYDIFDNNFGGVNGTSLDIGSFSEQAGIDFVAFLIDTMIMSQEFSSSIPTVGGDIHIGIITAKDGFKWISKEEYKFQDHTTPKFDHVGNS